IYDQREATRPRTIYADSARMAYSEDRTDLYLTLYDGVTHQWRRTRPGSFQRIFFEKQIMQVPDVTNRLDRGSGGGYRGDREMSIAEMRVEVDSADARARRIHNSSQAFTWAATRYLLGDSVHVDETRYLSFVSDSGSSDVAAARAADSAAGDSSRPTAGGRVVPAGDSSRIGALSAAAFEISELRIGLRALRDYRGARTVTSRYGVFSDLLDSAQQRRSRFAVEIQKKIAIPVACVVFVLIGAPIAIRYPLGGVGMVVGVSFGFFCAYYVALVGGEELADRLILSPFWAMWAPNILFGSVGLGFVWRAIKVG
ncbi:MAG: LptF/LptG family permease, partial [Gemmatimonadota bacterium]